MSQFTGYDKGMANNTFGFISKNSSIHSSSSTLYTLHSRALRLVEPKHGSKGGALLVRTLALLTIKPWSGAGISGYHQED